MASGIFYDPSVHDWGSKAARGMQSGFPMAAQAQQMKANQTKMDETKKMEAVKSEIAAAYKEFEPDLKGATDETQKGMMATDQAQAIQAEGTPTGMETPAIAERVAAEGSKPKGFAGLLAEEQGKEAQAKPLVAKAQFMTKARDIFNKHGMVDQAMALENNYMKHVGTIATTIGKKAAFKELKTGMFKDSFQDMTADDIEDKGDHFQIEKVGPNNDGIVKFNKKDGNLTIVQQPTPKEEKEKDERTEEYGHGQRRFVSGPRKGEVVKVPTKGEGGAGGDGKGNGKDEKWTIPKIRAEWDKVASYAERRAKEIEGELNKIEDPDERAHDPLNTEMDSLRKVQKNIFQYRKNDADAVKQGNDPVNIDKVASYLSAPGESKGGASGKVSGETKNLIKGKFTKVVEDPKTKKRYGVKPDGTKELIGA